MWAIGIGNVVSGEDKKSYMKKSGRWPSVKPIGGRNTDDRHLAACAEREHAYTVYDAPNNSLCIRISSTDTPKTNRYSIQMVSNYA